MVERAHRGFYAWAIVALSSGAIGGCYSGLNVDAAAVEQDTDGPDAPDADTRSSGDSGDPDGNPAGGDAAELSPMTRMPRLTTQEYTNTVRDLLRDPDLPPPSLTETVDGRLDQGLTSDYMRAAEGYAESVAHDPAALARILDCEPSDECASAFIAGFGLRVYRRPLSDEEHARYEALYDARAEVAEDASFESGIELVLSAMLQSPFFLHKVELSDEVADNGLIAVSDFEMASRLSYMLWHTMPDDALLATAGGGGLHTDAQISDAVDRLLDDPRADETIISFHEAWMHLDLTQAVFTEDDAEITDSLRASLRTFLAYALFEQGGAPEQLLTSSRVFVDETLAPLYGVEVDPQTGVATVDEPGRRFGILTQPFALAVHTNPVHRGLFVHHELLCTSFPPPPELTPEQEDLLDDEPEPGTTRRERIEAGFENPECQGCHAIINPPGFSLEHYDDLGRFRELDNGLPVDASGEMMIDGQRVTFADAGELAVAIARSDAFRACYAQHWAKQLFGTQEVDDAAIAPLLDALKQEDYRVEDMIRAAALSDAVRYRSTQEWDG